MPSPYRDSRLEAPDLSEVKTWDTPLLSDKSGYIRFVDIKRLVALAKFSHVKVHVVRRVGQFVPAGTPLLMVYKGKSAHAGDQRRISATPSTLGRPELYSRTLNSEFCRSLILL